MGEEADEEVSEEEWKKAVNKELEENAGFYSKTEEEHLKEMHKRKKKKAGELRK